MNKLNTLVTLFCLFGIVHLNLARVSTTIENEAPQQSRKKSFKLTKEVSITMIWVPSGDFLMGSPPDELAHDETREKQHKVTITKGFWLAETEFTQADWVNIMKKNPSNKVGDKLPVESVSYFEVMHFLKRINAKDNVFRLPTEAEWEFACRAGTSGLYDGIRDNTTWHMGNSGRQSQLVATKQPNPWGFYDMHGNILEWCSDWYLEDNFTETIDPKGPKTGTYKVNRGGQFTGRTRHTRAADRQRAEPDSSFFYVGFRLAADE